MNINNNIKYNNTQAFCAVQSKAEDMTNKEQTAKDSKNLAIVLAKAMENYVPEYGKFSQFSLGFEIKGTQNEVKYAIECDPGEPNNLRRFSIGVKKKASDAIEKEYLAKGTKEEIQAFLKDNLDMFPDVVEELSESVDERNY